MFLWLAFDRMDSRAAAERFVQSLGNSAFDDLEAVLAPDVAFRILVPPGLRHCNGAANAADYFRGWFGPERVDKTQPCNGDPYPFLATTSLQLVDATIGETIAGRTFIAYQLDLQNERGHCRCLQSGFVTTDEANRITGLDLVCSGIRPVG